MTTIKPQAKEKALRASQGTLCSPQANVLNKVMFAPSPPVAHTKYGLGINEHAKFLVIT
jgi:hypothetical protein